jgi:hypothetical protein
MDLVALLVLVLYLGLRNEIFFGAISCYPLQSLLVVKNTNKGFPILSGLGSMMFDQILKMVTSL